MSLRLKDSKTDKSHKGVFIYIGCTDKDVCAVCAMSFYLLKHKNLTDDPNSLLFLHNNHLPLTCSHMVNSTELHIAILGLQTDQYSGHSYRIGGKLNSWVGGLVMLILDTFVPRPLCLQISLEE